MQLNFISMPIVFMLKIKLCKQILSSFNGILTKSIMVNEMKILLILILIHNILAIGSILALFCTVRPQCKFQFEQIYLIFKSWSVQCKISSARIQYCLALVSVPIFLLILCLPDPRFST